MMEQEVMTMPAEGLFPESEMIFPILKSGDPHLTPTPQTQR